MTDWVDAVLAFWFDALAPKDWWSGAPDVDARVRERFAGLLDAMTRAPPDGASLDARGHLAAVIVFDQFSRQLHRGSALAFANDARARGRSPSTRSSAASTRASPSRSASSSTCR